MSAESLRSFRTQNLLLEFAALAYVRPTGIYMSLTPGNPRLWSGVLFVRKGPYKTAVLRFRVIFPSDYPLMAPMVVFVSDVFHPLVVASSGNPRHVDEKLDHAPGSFNLCHEFPRWADKGVKHDNAATIFESVVSVNRVQATSNSLKHDEQFTGEATVDMPIVKVLRHLRSCFEEDKLIDSIALENASNTSAWYAWKAHRAVEKTASQASGSPKTPSEWNWDGVFASRCERTVRDSLTETALYGNTDELDDMVQFTPILSESSPG